MQDPGRDNSKLYDTRGTSDPFLRLASVARVFDPVRPGASCGATHSLVADKLIRDKPKKGRRGDSWSTRPLKRTRTSTTFSNEEYEEEEEVNQNTTSSWAFRESSAIIVHQCYLWASLAKAGTATITSALSVTEVTESRRLLRQGALSLHSIRSRDAPPNPYCQQSAPPRDQWTIGGDLLRDLRLIG
ncbi:hypothetical protein RR46_06491 [Papilio xuthus]|uniref:Uncharacterized protein n=1 Tax=Papilio xuthus TaxID=66420 RepID=A0A194QEG1_PAPXU|nr:hypothetical protein RR46_06491 [Papilio xuthus]